MSGTNGKASRKPGRPSLFRAEYAEMAYRLALLGLTDAQMAVAFDVSERAINDWKRAHPAFREALNKGKLEADAKVADSLFKAATGGHSITEQRTTTEPDGSETRVAVESQVPPDTQAMRWWLKNRQPEAWRDKVEIQKDINMNAFPPKEVLDGIYNRALAEAAKRDAMLIGRRERLGIVIDSGVRDVD